MRKILKGIILSLIIIGLIKTFNEYDVIHCANHYAILIEKKIKT